MMKKTMLYIAIAFVVLFIIQVFRNSPVTKVDDSDNPMYGFKRDTTTYVPPPMVVDDKGTPVKDPLKSIIEKLYTYKYLWFADQEEYMVRDTDFVNPIIREVLAKENNGQLPKNTGGVEEIARQVIYKYNTKINEPEGLERIEKLIQQRYDSPVVDTETNGVHISRTVDLGVLPTKLSVSIRHGIIRTRNTGMTDENGRWISREIAQQLVKYNNDFPNRIIFRVKFSPDYGGLETSFLFTYIAKIPRSSFPPLISIRPENYYGTASKSSLVKTFYLLHDLEDYANNKYSIYEIDDYKYRQMSSSGEAKW